MGAENLTPPGFNPQTVQLIASCYSDYVILAYIFNLCSFPKEKVFILHATVDHHKNSIVFKCHALVSWNSRTAAVPLLMYVHEKYINTWNTTATILTHTAKFYLTVTFRSNISITESRLKTFMSNQLSYFCFIFKFLDTSVRFLCKRS